MRKFQQILLVVLAFTLLMGFSRKTVDSEVLYQLSTIGALLQGVYDGDTTIKELKKHGGFAIGTWNALDGEMIALDGKFYKIKSDGVPYLMGNDVKTPFAMVTIFNPEQAAVVSGEMSYNQLKQYLDSKLKTKNIFYAIKVEGVFKYIKVRSVYKQKKPYPPLMEAIKTQPIFEHNDIEGTLVGYRSPDYIGGINIPGYHFHFISADKKAGGHVLTLKLASADIGIDDTHKFRMTLPEGGDFYTKNLGGAKKKSIDAVEK